MVELKLVDQTEFGYTVKNIDKETGKSRPIGELCVRGPAVFKGYFRDLEKTKDPLDKDGWLHSGDIAMIIPEHKNTFKFVYRVKNIFKMQQGNIFLLKKLKIFMKIVNI